jgi:hypothetical protein
MSLFRGAAAWSLLLIVGLPACGDSTDPVQPADEFNLVLFPESNLVSGCFGWPDQEFSSMNHTGGVQVSVSAGDRATEFTLRDPSGNPRPLSELLETRPVLLVFGGFT